MWQVIHFLMSIILTHVAFPKLKWKLLLFQTLHFFTPKYISSNKKIHIHKVIEAQKVNKFENTNQGKKDST